jgi:hypothetical protein
MRSLMSVTDIHKFFILLLRSPYWTVVIFSLIINVQRIRATHFLPALDTSILVNVMHHSSLRILLFSEYKYVSFHGLR